MHIILTLNVQVGLCTDISAIEFMKYIVKVDSKNPILPCLFLKRKGRKSVWLYMKYEKLPNIYFQCRRMNHESNMCKEKRMGGVKMYGSLLRAG